MTALDRFIAIYEALMPKKVYLVRNGSRYVEITGAMRDIETAINAATYDAVFNVESDELTGTTLALEVECDLLAITEVEQFCNAIRTSDSIDIVPLTNGNLSVVFGFNDAYIPAPPHNAE